MHSTTAFGGNATAAMASVGIHGRAGPQFGGLNRQVRLELLMREETFELLAAKLRKLVHPELLPDLPQ